MVRLLKLDEGEDQFIAENIANMRKANKPVTFQWSHLEWLKCNRPLDKIPRNSSSFEQLVKSCFILAGQFFDACGLGKIRPVQDMK